MNPDDNTCWLFEVIGENPQARLSPYCWRSHMALAHKRLKFTSEPWHITEKDRIAPSGGITAPVLVDSERWIRDSWQIATYLDESYAAYPLFDGAVVRAKSLSLDNWADTTLHPLIFRAVIAEQFPLTAECDKHYYRQRALSKFHQSVEDIGANPEAARQSARHALHPMELTRTEAAFLGGEAPDYRDYILFGTFQWARVVSVVLFWTPNSSLQRWFDVMLDAFDGLGRKQLPRIAL